MLVSELHGGELLATIDNFVIWKSGGGWLRFVRWRHGRDISGPILYLGRRLACALNSHEVLYGGNICYINSMDLKYLNAV